MCELDKHTSGPWVLAGQNAHCGIAVETKQQEQVATVYLDRISSEWDWGDETIDQPDNAESKANALLIAAAPEMLKALENVLLAHEYDGALTFGSAHLSKAIEGQVKRIIEKARGQI